MTISQRPAPPDEMDEVDDMEGVADILRPTSKQWRADAKAQLDELGLTYEELEAQARDREFSSHAALKLWKWIGGTL